MRMGDLTSVVVYNVLHLYVTTHGTVVGQSNWTVVTSHLF